MFMDQDVYGMPDSEIWANKVSIIIDRKWYFEERTRRDLRLNNIF